MKVTTKCSAQWMNKQWIRYTSIKRKVLKHLERTKAVRDERSEIRKASECSTAALEGGRRWTNTNLKILREMIFNLEFYYQPTDWSIQRFLKLVVGWNIRLWLPLWVLEQASCWFFHSWVGCSPLWTEGLATHLRTSSQSPRFSIGEFALMSKMCMLLTWPRREVLRHELPHCASPP